MIYTASAIANEFIINHFDQINLMKLQKLVYYSHCWSLAVFERPLIVNPIEAWPYGPVIPQIIDKFVKFGSKRTINELAIDVDERYQVTCLRVGKEDKTTTALLDKVWECYSGLTGIQLSNMSHLEDDPWYQMPIKQKGIIIPNSLIEKAFKKKIKESE